MDAPVVFFGRERCRRFVDGCRFVRSPFITPLGIASRLSLVMNFWRFAKIQNLHISQRFLAAGGASQHTISWLGLRSWLGGQ